MHRDYLKEHRKGRYTNLLSEGTLNQRLYELDVEAKTMVESIILRLAAERGVDENLKARDILRWGTTSSTVSLQAMALASAVTALVNSSKFIFYQCPSCSSPSFVR